MTGAIVIKSKAIDLRKRGMVEQEDVEELSNLSQARLIQLINSESPTERTAAVRLLSTIGVCDIAVIDALIKRLSIEKALYTKLEICHFLEKGDIKTARRITRYLGKIGDNQHKELPTAVSKKKSYPLPRDIVARIMAKMDCSIFPVLAETLFSEDEIKISEALDAAGFMIFYNENLSTDTNLEIIVEAMERCSQNEIIYWKAVTCLSAFALKKSACILDRIISESKNALIRAEAIRSKQLISEKTAD